MRILANILFLLAAAAPFVMPPNAVVSDGSASGGWRQCGETALSYSQTRAQFGARFSAAGWRHKHTIVLEKARTVEAWERGGETLTFMAWGQTPAKTGFSWGLSRTDGDAGRMVSAGRGDLGTKRKTTRKAKRQ